jgi:hypothetical protein
MGLGRAGSVWAASYADAFSAVRLTNKAEERLLGALE